MKKIFWVILAIGVIAGCEKNNGGSEKNELDGTWNKSTYSATIVTGGMNLTIDQVDAFFPGTKAALETAIPTKVRFSGNNVTMTFSDGSTKTEAVKVKNGKIYYETGDTPLFSYTVSGDTLTLSVDKESLEASGYVTGSLAEALAAVTKLNAKITYIKES